MYHKSGFSYTNISITITSTHTQPIMASTAVTSTPKSVKATAEAPLSSDPDAKDDKSNPFDELFERELATVRSRLRSLDVPAVMEAGMKAAMGDDAGIERLQQEQQSKALTRNRKYLDQLWQTFDRDSNGILSREENRKLIRTYLAAAEQWTPQVVKESMAVGVEIGMRMSAEMSGEKLAADLVSEIHVHMASIQPQIEAVAKQVLTGIDANAVADEALGKLDSNNDGKVTRDEFILNFLAVMQDVFDPKQIIKSILDAMGM